MSVNNSQKNDFEQIYLDQRDYTLTDREIGTRISLLGNFDEIYKDKFGNEVDKVNRLLQICELTSYITDENFLNFHIEYVLQHFERKEFYIPFVEFIESINNTKLYSNLDLTKIKAICFFLVTKHAIFLRIYDTPNYPVPKFKIKLENENRIITHNLPLVEDTVLRNFDLEYIENLKEFPPQIAENILNERILSLINLDYQFGTNNSKEKIKYFKKVRKEIIAKHLENDQQQKNINTNERYKTQIFTKANGDIEIENDQQQKTINTNERYKTQNLFKVGLLFATGKMNKYFTINSLGNVAVKEGYSAPKIAKELGNNILPIYITASFNNYTDQVNGNKNIFNSLYMMNKVIEECESKKIEIDSYFMSRLPIE